MNNGQDISSTVLSGSGLDRGHGTASTNEVSSEATMESWSSNGRTANARRSEAGLEAESKMALVAPALDSVRAADVAISSELAWDKTVKETLSITPAMSEGDYQIDGNVVRVRQWQPIALTEPAKSESVAITPPATQTSSTKAKAKTAKLLKQEKSEPRVMSEMRAILPETPKGTYWEPRVSDRGWAINLCWRNAAGKVERHTFDYLGITEYRSIKENADGTPRPIGQQRQIIWDRFTAELLADDGNGGKRAPHGYLAERLCVTAADN